MTHRAKQKDVESAKKPRTVNGKAKHMSYRVTAMFTEYAGTDTCFANNAARQEMPTTSQHAKVK